ncbi:MAG TPA: hypothetical protein DCM05_18200 [Elusimicrobia bacterium]|nr:hypothetical protein [Elusimicrobiota bacterium]
MTLALALLLSTSLQAQESSFTVRKVGQLFDKAKNAPILGQDGAYSIPLESGALWTFGDTLVGETLPEGKDKLWGMPSSAYGLLKATSAASLEGKLEYFRDDKGWPRPLIAHEPGELESVRRLWPQHGVRVGAKVYVYYTLIQAYGTGMWHFASVGQGLAVSEGPAGPYRRLRRGESTVFWSDVEPAYGGAVLEDGGWLYLYGRGFTGPGAYAQFLARVRPDAIEDLGAYRYFAGGEAWKALPSEAALLFQDGVTELSVSWNDHLKKYLMIYSALQTVLMRTAPKPWGPWSAPSTVLECEDLAKDEFCYAAKEHPELAEEGGRRVVFTLVKSKSYVPEFHELRFDKGERK